MRKWLKKVPGQQNPDYNMKEHKNYIRNRCSKVTLHFVWGHLSRKQTVKWENFSSNADRVPLPTGKNNFVTFNGS